MFLNLNFTILMNFRFFIEVADNYSGNKMQFIPSRIEGF